MFFFFIGFCEKSSIQLQAIKIILVTIHATPVIKNKGDNSDENTASTTISKR